MTAPFLDAKNPADIERAAQLLRAGEVVALPTETVYGLAADAFNEAALRRVFEIKSRPFFDPLIVHVADWAMLEKLAQPNARAKKLADAFWPGALTFVLPKKPEVPALVTAGKPTVAVRMPAHPAMRAVLKAAGIPLAAPSANPFGYISPTCAAHVRDSLGERQPHILDAGPCVHGIESTIIDLSDPDAPARILRHGPVTREMIETALGEIVDTSAPKAATEPSPAGLPAPGLLKRHYSPQTPVTLLSRGTPPPPCADNTRQAWVLLKRPRRPLQKPERTDLFFLSENGQMEQIAHNMFAMLRTLDKGGYSTLFVELPPRAGLGEALHDRLRRAAAR